MSWHRLGLIDEPHCPDRRLTVAIQGVEADLGEARRDKAAPNLIGSTPPCRPRDQSTVAPGRHMAGAAAIVRAMSASLMLPKIPTSTTMSAGTAPE